MQVFLRTYSVMDTGLARHVRLSAVWPQHMSLTPASVLCSDFCSRQAHPSRAPTTHPLPQTHNPAKSTRVFHPTLPRLVPGMLSISSLETFMNSHCSRSRLSSILGDATQSFWPLLLNIPWTPKGPQYNESHQADLHSSHLSVCIVYNLYLPVYLSPISVPMYIPIQVPMCLNKHTHM